MKPHIETHEEFMQKMQALRDEFREEHLKLSASQKETNEQMKRTDEQIKKNDAKMQKMFDKMGSIENNLGKVAEEYFENVFETDKTFAGIKFDVFKADVKPFEPQIDDQYDIVLLNGSSVAIIETKLKAHENDLEKVIHKATTFRANYPKYAKHKIYLGLASFSFYKKLIAEARQKGIALIRQKGDKTEVWDKNLKAY